MSGGVLPLRGTTTAAGSERDLQRAKASNQTQSGQSNREGIGPHGVTSG